MEIKFTKENITLIIYGYELAEHEIYLQELAYNVWKQRDIMLTEKEKSRP